MVVPAERYGEFVADFAAQGARLGEAKVVSLRWRSGANQARLAGDKLKVLPAAKTFWQGEQQGGGFNVRANLGRGFRPGLLNYGGGTCWGRALRIGLFL